MAKDFRSGQIRITQIIASGSTASAPSLLIASASSPGMDYDGSGISNTTLMANVGTDVFIFVSGTSGSLGTSTPGATLFGGDVFISGVLAVGGGTVVAAGGSDTQVQYNNGGILAGDAGLVYDNGSFRLSVSGNLDVTGSAVIGTNLTVTGDLTVNGTTTTVATDNLVVKDPLIYIASGGTTSNQEGGLAIASGSSTAGQALVFGRVANDSWGAGKLDVEAGEIAGGDVSAMTLVGIRASEFQIGSGSPVLSSSDGASITLRSAGGSAKITITPGTGGVSMGNSGGPHGVTGSNIRFGNVSAEFGSEIPPQPGTDSYFFVSGTASTRGTATAGTAVFGGDLYVSGVTFAEGGVSGSLTRLIDGTSYLIAGPNITITSASNGGVTIVGGIGGEKSAQYLVLAATASLDAERVLTMGAGLSGTDAGAGAGFTIAIDNSVVATVSGTTFTGATIHEAGMSGSLTQLGDGTSYLIEGSNITITSASNGAITIASSAGATSGTFNVPSPSAFVTTASVSFAGGQGLNYSASTIGADTYFFTSGTIGSRGSATAGTAVFGGDLYISGATYISNSLSIGNSTLTEDADNDLTITAGRVIFVPSEAAAAAFQVVTGGGGGLQLVAGNIGLGLNSGNGILTLTSSQVVVGTQSDEFGDTPPAAGVDTSFFVSGSLASKGTTVRGAAVFGGDVIASGTLTAESGLSGSLTQLSDGSSYLIAGANMTVTSASNGAVTIASTGGGTSFWSSSMNETIYTTGSFIVAGNSGIIEGDDIGTDVLNFVTGVIGSKDTATPGVTIFGGDVVVSGTLHGGSPLVIGSNIQLTGSLEATTGLSGSLTQLSDGSSYLIAGANMTVTSASNGAVTIASTGGGSSPEYWTSGLAGSIYTTGSIIAAGSTGFIEPGDVGTDVYHYITGTKGDKDGAVPGITVFNGDIVSSGTIYGGFDSDLSATTITVNSGLLIFEGDTQTQPGTDVNFLVSGSIDSVGTAVRGTAVFGGDVVISGTLDALGGLKHQYGGIYMYNHTGSQVLVSDVSERIDFNASGGLATSGSSGITIDVANNELIATIAGTYQLCFHASLVGPNNTEFELQTRVNDVPQNHISAIRTIDSTGNAESVGAAGMSVLSANDNVSLWVKGNATSVEVIHCNLSMHQLE